MTEPKKLTDYLNNVNYSLLDSYIPSPFTLELINLIKLISNNSLTHKTPVTHLFMIDKMFYNRENVINLCHRGFSKTTLFRYLIWYLAIYGTLPYLGNIVFALYVSDTIDNGIKTMKRNLLFEYENSEFLQKFIPKVNITEQIWEFVNIDNKPFTCQGYGAQAMPLNTKVFNLNKTSTIASSQIGDMIYGAEGDLCKIIAKSPIFNAPMYRITLTDGRYLDVSDNHINSIVVTKDYKSSQDINLTTLELLQYKLQHIRHRRKSNGQCYISKETLLFIRNTAPIQFIYRELPVEPYTLGLLLGDGSMRKDGSNILHTSIKDIYEYEKYIPYELGKPYYTNNAVSTAIKGISKNIKELNLTGIKANKKYIPSIYLRSSIKQRYNLLAGLLDTDGTVLKTGRVQFTSISKRLCLDIIYLIRSLGGTAHLRISNYKDKNNIQISNMKRNYDLYQVEIWLKEYKYLFKLPRKLKRLKNNKYKKRWLKRATMVGIKSIEPIKPVPSQCIHVDNKSHQFIVNDFFRTHNSGVRGTTVNGARPRIAFLDDLMSDKVANSPSCIENIENTVYKAVRQALDPVKRKTVWAGTLFNAKDPLHKAIESGAWEVNVFPICETFPCKRRDFKGSWPERFTYDFVKKEHNDLKKLGKIAAFNQELMLRIMSDSDRVINDNDINWYRRSQLLQNKSSFNYYIVTDFATSERSSGDYSVILVFGLNNKGQWFLVDGICKQQLMNANIDDLFRLVQRWNPQQVGIEVSGQQGGFIPWIQDQMLVRNIYFNIASENNSNKPGIRPNTAKLTRFNVIVPWFKSGLIFFPLELKDTILLIEGLNELELVSTAGMKSKHDDFLDCLSMLALLKTWKPSEVTDMKYKDDSHIWEIDEIAEEAGNLESYIV